jgi:uncharacterized repeat protein (TIGR01451 family)
MSRENPLRVVAPVGGEVVLLAGICGKDGYLVKREPIEWMLSPDSVGQIIEVSDDAPGKLSSFLHPHRPKVEKLDVDFAKGRTSSKAQVIDRGTPDCNDDIHLRDGETWLSISSPTAGVSRITALAPESKIWDQRRQTAVIYWLDAQWAFPQAQIVKAPEQIQLNTRVTQAEGFVPAAGWFVQYTIVDPSKATFIGPPEAVKVDERTIRTVVNNDGLATAILAPVPGSLGTTPVLIDVISRARPEDGIPELTVGRGQTFATFSAAGLQLEAFGPEMTTKGEQVSFTAILANPGDLNAENAKLVMNIPEGLRFISANPNPTITNTGLVWDQGVLPANRQLDVTVFAEAVLPETYNVDFFAEAAGINRITQTIRTTIVEPALDVKFGPADGVSQANTGDVVTYEVDITNTGRQSLSNIKLMVKADRALVEVSQQTNEVEQVIPLLLPGERRQLHIPFRIQQEGQHRAILQVLAGNAPLVQKEGAILGLPPRPKRADIGVAIQFPTRSVQQRSIRVGDEDFAVVSLRNSGEVALTNLEVLISADPRVLEIVGVDPSNVPYASPAGEGQVRWTPPDLLPSDRGDRVQEATFKILAKSPLQNSVINVIARSAQGVQSNASAQFEVRPNISNVTPPVNPPVNPPVGPSVTPPVTPNNSPPNTSPQPSTGDTPPTLPAPNNGVNPLPPTRATGKLGIEINDFNDPELVMKPIRYGLTVANQSDQANRRVQIELRIPEGCELVGVSSQGSEVRATFRGAGVVLPEIQTLRVGERLEYVIILRSRIPQQMQVEASVRSDLFPNAEKAVQTTTILPAN